MVNKHRRGFTLIEALLAAGILAGAVVVVTWAVTAGQQQALYAKVQISAAMAAEDLMGQILVNNYDDLEWDWNGHYEQISSPRGTLTVDVTVANMLKDLPGLDVRVDGLDVAITVSDEQGRLIAQTCQFIPDPTP